LIQSNATLEFTTALLIGLLLGSFVEYAVHRLMHMGKFMGPKHAKHHRENMWHHNFGIGVSFWDRIWGTYRAADWQPEHRARDYPLREFIDIRWR
jgi:sterol desaturase/sphingolipid hydroxylase (fatty acid hydroxylase superfamily)